MFWTERAPLRHLLIEHDKRIPDAQAGVHDLAIRAGHSTKFDRAERVLVKFDRIGRPGANEMRRDGVHSFRNWFGGWFHGFRILTRRAQRAQRGIAKIDRRSSRRFCWRWQGFGGDFTHEKRIPGRSRGFRPLPFPACEDPGTTPVRRRSAGWSSVTLA